MPVLVNTLMKNWGEIMVPHYVHQINIMSKVSVLLICVTTNQKNPPTLKTHICEWNLKKKKNCCQQKNTVRAAMASSARQKRLEKSNILHVAWSFADLAMARCRANPFPVRGAFAHSWQSGRNQLAKRRLFLRGHQRVLSNPDMYNTLNLY